METLTQALDFDISSSRLPCVVMFSGGRDSTLAALRMAEAGMEMALVTVIAPHLRGIDAVRHRISELRGKLPDYTPYLEVVQPSDLATDISFYSRTCLPCHHAYVTIAAACVALLGARKLAFGYTAYQSHWPEQTPQAIESLRSVLKNDRRELLLPVHDLKSKEDAQSELRRRGVSDEALEQKCSRQIFNVTLKPEHLTAQIALWEAAMQRSLSNVGTIKFNVPFASRVGDIDSRVTMSVA